MVHFIPTTEKTLVEGLARLFRDNVWKLHGLLESIIVKDVRNGVTPEWEEVDNKVKEQPWPQLVCCALICCHACGCVFQED